MGDVQESRRKNFELVRSARGETWKELAKVLGVTSSYLSQIMKGTRAFTEKSARVFERKLGLRSGYLDDDPSTVVGTVTRIDTELLADVAVRVMQFISRDKHVKLSPIQTRKVISMTFIQATKDGSVDEAYIKQLVALAGSG